jgi:thiol-disulfide isomerase/thioredoxin
MRTFLSKLFGGGEPRVDPGSLPVEGRAPEFARIAAWFNSEPVAMASLRGKVVLVDFWTYSCINCIRTLPHVKAWHDAYKDRGLVIVGVHTPEFEFEKDPENVKAAIARYGIEYPVALDNDYATWEAYKNHYWPAHYFIDAKGNVRYHHFGEGAYGHSEAVIRALLAEAGSAPPETVAKEGGKAPDFSRIGTPETYLGFDRMEYLGSPESVRLDEPSRYSAVNDPALNIFYFDGSWDVKRDHAVPAGSGARLVYKCRASKVNLVMAGSPEGKRVRVRVDGKALGDAMRGTDAKDENGEAVVTVKDGRLYELVDAKGDYADKLLELTFLDPGTKCYAFTFG